MKRAWLVLVLAGCESGGDGGLPNGLWFAERSVQLQPELISPTFTMPVPAAWEQTSMLVSGGALVNGANEVNPDYRSEARFYAPDGDRGLLNLAISCEGECAVALQRRLFEQWSAYRTISDRTFGRDRAVAFHDPDGDDDLYVMRLWWPMGETRFRLCGFIVPEKWAKAWRAFEDACAAIVEFSTARRP